MNVLLLTVFVSLMLALGAVLLFSWGWSKGEHQHSDRLALLPLEDDGPPSSSASLESPPAAPSTGLPTSLPPM